MKDLVRRAALSAVRVLSALWLIVGITLAIFLIAESSYRVVKYVSVGANDAAPRPDDPGNALPWWNAFSREIDAIRPQRWKPYVYFGKLPSYHGRYVNIDAFGHRVTPQPSVPALPVARVFFFGGSTMWGTSLRDSATIPAEASRRLQAMAGPGQRIEVTNYGEIGYVSTQGVLELMLALRTGHRPDVVVFVDGINDAGSTLQYGAAGFPQNESKRASEFSIGRALDRTSADRGLGHDLRALRVLTSEAFKQSALVEWALSRHPPAPTPLLSVDSAAHNTADIYTQNMRIVEGLSMVYGFTPLYVWQPTIHATRKKLTSYEGQLMRGIRKDPFQVRLQEVHLAVPALLDSSMAELAPGRFVEDAWLFTGDPQPVFVDRIGHNTESSIPQIVDSFWPSLKAAVGKRDAIHEGSVSAARTRDR